MKFHGNIKGLVEKLSDKIKNLKHNEKEGAVYTITSNGDKLINWNETTGTIEVLCDSENSHELFEIFNIVNDNNSKVENETKQENFLGDIYPDSELVIGLVGAVGSRLGQLTEILNGYLGDRFKYDVEVISVSSQIIKKYKNDKIKTDDEFSRIKSYMDSGNELRSESKDNSFVALDAARVISEVRERRNKDGKNKRVAYIINSLKHDEEIKRLRQIYSEGFYQISLYESSQRRSEYLIKDKGMQTQQVDELIQRDEGEEKGHGQHTRDAFHLADYFVKYDGSYDGLRNSCFRFLSLIFGDPFITPTFDEFATYMAFTSSLRSADLSRQVGAVIARDETILSTGANDIPKFGGGLYWPVVNEITGEVTDTNDGRDYKRAEDSNVKEKERISQDLINSLLKLIDSSCVSTSENKVEITTLKDGIQEVVKNSKIKDITEYGRVVHAEMETLMSCSRESISTKGATLYATTFPCHNCAKHIIAAGIERVVFVEPYPKSKALDFHRESVTIGFDTADDKIVFEPFVGVGARNFLNVFSMSLGSGYELKRKSKNGSTLPWSPNDSQLRTALLPYSYLQREDKAKERIKQLSMNV